MKTQTLLLGTLILAAGFGAVIYLSKNKNSLTLGTTSATNAPAPGGGNTQSQISGYVSEAGQLFGFLNGAFNNSGSTNSNSGVSASGSVATRSSVADTYDEASDLWNMYA